MGITILLFFLCHHHVRYGYGLVYLLTSLFLWWKVKSWTISGKRILKLAIMLSHFLFFGSYIRSFLGMNIDPHNPFSRWNILHALSYKKADYHLQKR